MFRIRIPLAIVVISILGTEISCANIEEGDKTLKIQTDNQLKTASGILQSDEKGVVTMRALSYPSSLKFYTEGEVLRILRFTCDSRASLPRIYGRDEHSLSAEWNYTAKAKGAGGKTIQGAPRFGATLTELEPGVLSIFCGERVY